MPSKFIDSPYKERAAITCVDSPPDEGDPTLVAAAKGGNLQRLKFWSSVTSKEFSSLRGA